MIHKKASKSYYFKPTRIIGEYILACLFCMVYEAVQEGGSVFNITKEFFLRILGIRSFESARYGWYVEMYIGLFLLIPYLNILYNNLQDKRSKQGLILTLLLLSGIPAVGNSLCFHIPWTMRYNDPSDFLKTLPSWWEMFYPVTYYMIGAYLSEYPLNLSKAKIGALTLIATLFVGTFNYLTNADKEFIYISFNNYESLFTVVLAVLVFSFFLKLDLQKMGPGVQKLLSHISGLCFAHTLFHMCLIGFFIRYLPEIWGF